MDALDAKVDDLLGTFATGFCVLAGLIVAT